MIKAHAFLEAALTNLLADHLGKDDLLPVFAYLETNNVRTGKLAFVKAFDLLDKGARRFIHTLSELRTIWYMKSATSISNLTRMWRAPIVHLPLTGLHHFHKGVIKRPDEFFALPIG